MTGRYNIITNQTSNYLQCSNWLTWMTLFSKVLKCNYATTFPFLVWTPLPLQSLAQHCPFLRSPALSRASVWQVGCHVWVARNLHNWERSWRMDMVSTETTQNSNKKLISSNKLWEVSLCKFVTNVSCWPQGLLLWHNQWNVWVEAVDLYIQLPPNTDKNWVM